MQVIINRSRKSKGSDGHRVQHAIATEDEGVTRAKCGKTFTPSTGQVRESRLRGVTCGTCKRRI
jgi:hypothetical protein